jgi:hypothetical protein
MNVAATDKDTVIVRGMNEYWLKTHFQDMKVYFGSTEAPQAIPARDANYIGFYLEAPVSAISHIGIVKYIQTNGDGGKTFFLRAIIKLDKPISPPNHPYSGIRKHEYWQLSDLGLSVVDLDFH